MTRTAISSRLAMRIFRLRYTTISRMSLGVDHLYPLGPGSLHDSLWARRTPPHLQVSIIATSSPSNITASHRPGWSTRPHAARHALRRFPGALCRRSRLRRLCRPRIRWRP
jgi:hypothetical protein